MLDLLALAQQCAPDIPSEVIVAIATKESSGRQFAIGHPSIGEKNQPKTFGEAVRIMDNLALNGQRYDAGLMQISSANFNWLGLDNVTVLDPCLNITAAQTVIKASIRTDNPAEFFNAVSRYNSGNEKTGYKNGYVTDIAVKLINPPIELPMRNIPPQTDTANTHIEKESELPSSLRAPSRQGLFSRSSNSKGLFSQQKEKLRKQVASDIDAHENSTIFSSDNTEDAKNQVHRLQRLDRSHQQRLTGIHATDTSSIGKMEMYESHP